MKRLLLLVAFCASPVLADVETTAVPPPMGGGGGGVTPGTAFVGQIQAPAADNCTSPPYSFASDTDTGVCTATADNLSLRTGGTNRGTISSTSLTTTVPILGPDGTNAAPTFSWSGETNSGLYRVGSNNFGFTFGGNRKWVITGTILGFDPGVELSWYSSGFAAQDLRLTRENAAVLQMGTDANGAAVAQTLKAHDGITGTDIAGANMTFAAGRSTGAGTVGDLALQTATALGTGTTATTLVTRYQAEGSLRALTDATATTVITVGTGNDLSCGGQIFFTVEAADAANQQTTSGIVSFAAADNAAGAGGEACAAGLAGTNVSAATSGTLSVTTDATTGTDLCNIRLTATGSLTETVGPRVRYSVVFNPTSSSCSFTPQ